MDQQYILVLVGPSGCGKTTVGQALEEDYGIKKLVTTTTRLPRPGEEDGIDYYFIEPSDIPQLDFVERTLYNGHHYGLTTDEIDQALDTHNHLHLAMDKNGAKAMKDHYPDHTRVVYFTISEADMVKRMKERGDSEADIQERLDFRRQSHEAQCPDQVDLVLENKDIGQTIQTILDFIHQQ